MRIALVTTSYPAFPDDPSGHFVGTEAKRIARDHEVFVIVPRQGGAFGWPGIAARVRARPHRAVGAVAWALEARRTLRSFAPLDRIVAHWATPSAWPIATGLGVPVEIVSHGGDVRLLLALPGALRRFVIDRILADAEAWRFVSSSLLLSLLEALDASHAKQIEAIARVEAAPIEIPDVTDLAREKRAAHPRVALAVCVGRLVPAKQVDRIVDYVAGELGKGTRLVVVGDGPLMPRLEEYARARGVDAAFVGRAPRSEALAWIAAADVVLHASRAEGLSTVEREAEGLGVPFRFVGTVSASGDLR
jgi:teichuronic acid biosynthesis glycosyltransferase TuaC